MEMFFLFQLHMGKHSEEQQKHGEAVSKTSSVIIQNPENIWFMITRSTVAEQNNRSDNNKTIQTERKSSV